jgi:chromosome segregation and condensation protein ScpB
MLAKKLKLAEEALSLQREKVRALERHNEIILFASATPAQDSQAAEYFSLMKAEALSKAIKRISSSEDQTSSDLEHA